MAIKCYLLENTSAAGNAITHIANMIPCFFHELIIAEENLAITIECRDYDLAFVERTLAPYV